MTVSTRVCARCHSEKPTEAFPIKDKTRGTRRSYCLPCCREYGREHYERNKPAYIGRARSRNADLRPVNRAFIRSHLSTHPCVDCGTDELVILEFDHRDPRAKSDNVCRLIQSGSLDNLKAEVAKCDVRCGNCHRRKTLLQFHSYRTLMSAAHA